MMQVVGSEFLHLIISNFQKIVNNSIYHKIFNHNNLKNYGSVNEVPKFNLISLTQEGRVCNIT